MPETAFQILGELANECEAQRTHVPNFAEVFNAKLDEDDEEDFAPIDDGDDEPEGVVADAVAPETEDFISGEPEDDEEPEGIVEDAVAPETEDAIYGAAEDDDEEDLAPVDAEDNDEEPEGVVADVVAPETEDFISGEPEDDEEPEGPPDEPAALPAAVELNDEVEGSVEDEVDGEPEDDDHGYVELNDEVDGEPEDDEIEGDIIDHDGLIDSVAGDVSISLAPVDDTPADVAFDLALTKYKHPTVLGSRRPTVLGALVERGAVFRDYAEKRIEASRPNVVPEFNEHLARDWQIDFGPAWAPAGEVTTISIPQQILFRGEKLIATDSFDTPGAGTRIVKVSVGQKIQRPAGGPGATLTMFFAQNAFGNGVYWDTCQPGLEISVTVSFMQSCTFDCTVFGRAVV